MHLFLDFSPLRGDIGSLEEYKIGVNEYAESLIARLEDETGLSSLTKFVDVTSSDMGRLCRVPNTLHIGATESFGEPRFCVPVSIEELASVTPSRYLSLTREPRPSPYDGRSPNGEAGAIIEQHVKEADLSARYTQRASAGSDVNPGRVKGYRERSNDNITAEMVPKLLWDRPALLGWLSRDDKWDYGMESHAAEIAFITELVNKDVPIDVIKECLSSTDGYDEQYTQDKIEQVISRGYDRWSRNKLRRQLPTFT